MKRTIAFFLSFITWVSAGLSQPTVNVTFIANTSTVPDTLSAESFVQIRGSIPDFGQWTSVSPAMLANVGGDYWVGTFPLLVGDTIEFKFFTHPANPLPVGQENTGWESNVTPEGGLPTFNRVLIVGVNDTTLPIQFVNGWADGVPQYWRPYAESENVEVLFRVNMSDNAAFDRNTQYVGVRGGTPPLDWGVTNLLLTRENSHSNNSMTYDGTNFWSGVATFPLSAFATQVEYKFVILDAPYASANIVAWEVNIQPAPDVIPDANTNRFIPARADQGDTTLSWKYWENRPAISQLAPPPPGLVSPTPGELGVPIPPQLSWNESAGATSYGVEVALDPGFTSPVYNASAITDTTTAVNGLAPLTTYYWRVNAANAYGSGEWSEVGNFSTQEILPPVYSSRWEFSRVFYNSSNSLGIQGLAVDPEGKVWIAPYNPTENVWDGTTSRPTRALYVLAPDGTPAPFSPILMLQANATWDTLFNSSRGLSTDHQGNILYSAFDALYRIDYHSGLCIAKVVPQPGATLTAAASDSLGNVVVGKVLPGNPVQMFDASFGPLGNVVDASTGYSRSVEISRNGNDVYWAEYSQRAITRFHSETGASGPYVNSGIVLPGLAVESMAWNRSTGLLWVSSGSDFNPPLPPWPKQTWFGYDPASDQVVDTIGWFPSPGTQNGRPRAIAFSPTGDTAYVGVFFSDGPVVQMFVRSGVPGPDNAALFNSSTARVRVLDGLGIHPAANPDAYKVSGTAITVEAWIYAAAFPDRPLGNTIVSRPLNVDRMDPYESFRLYVDWSNAYPQVAFSISDGTPGSRQIVVSPDTLRRFQWTHLASTYDGSELRIYVNGVLKGQASTNIAITPEGLGFYIGRFLTDRFQGVIDEVRLWNTARSQAEIQSSMNAHLTGTELFLRGCWRLDKSTTYPNGTQGTADATQYHNDLIVQGGAQFIPWTPGSPLPQLSVNTSSIDFGIFEAGEQKKVIVTNLGPSTLFGYAPYFILQPGESWTVSFKAPISVTGEVLNFIELQSNAANAPTVFSVTGSLLPSKTFDANSIRMFVLRNGRTANDPIGVKSGLEWPKGTGKTAVYQAGIWIAALVNGVPTTGVAHYNSEFRAGPAFDGVPENPSNSRYRVYKISRGDNAAVNPDYAEWPADLGAPVNSDGTPKLLGDQTLFSVYNELNPEGHVYGSSPIGAEVRQTTFGFNKAGTLQNTVFVHYSIINRSSQHWTNAYAALWSDPDLGDAYDDLVGSDPQRDLAYAYNGFPADAMYGDAPPSVGYVFLQGAAGGKPMRNFTYHAAGIEPLNDPNNPTQFYNYAQGKTRDGLDYIDPMTGLPTLFPLSGDPLSSTGWVDQGPSDRRIVISSGPFDLAPGGHAEMLVAIVVGQGSNNLASISALRSNVDYVRVFYAQGLSMAPPPSWAFTENTGRNATIGVHSVINPTIGTRSLRTGDAIGVFFNRDGQLVCGGYSIWHEGQSMAITVWGDDMQTPEKDGFADGEVLKYKIWDGQEGIEFRAEATYQSGGPSYQTNGIYTLSSLHGITTVDHRIPLRQGWNMISSYAAPADSLLDVMLAGIRPNMVLMKNGGGQVYWPSFGINQIGRWNVRHGYQVYMQAWDTLMVRGHVVVPEQTPLSLGQGWNLISYIRTSPMVSEVALQSILGTLVIAKNNAGQVFWPAFGINTIGQFKPGEGYQVYVSEAGTLRYPGNSGSTARTLTPQIAEVQKAAHYVPAAGRSGDNAVMLVRVQGATDGDEVGIWTSSGVLIGAGPLKQGSALLTIWGDDPITTQTVEGAAEGEALTLRVWDKAQQKEKNLSISGITDGLTNESAEPSLKYQGNAALVVAARVAVDVPKEYVLEQNHPNPFNPSTIIRYGLPKDAMVTLEVYNLLGQAVSVLVPGIAQKAGYYDVVFTQDGLPSGVYVYRIHTEDFTSVKKMLLIR